jgi:hypothetical protein
LLCNFFFPAFRVGAPFLFAAQRAFIAAASFALPSGVIPPFFFVGGAALATTVGAFHYWSFAFISDWNLWVVFDFTPFSPDTNGHFHCIPSQCPAICPCFS